MFRFPERTISLTGNRPAVRFARRLVCLALALSIGPLFEVRAGDTPAYSIACRLQFDRDPALSVALTDAVREQIQRIFEAILGPEQRLRFLSEETNGELPYGPPGQLDQDSVSPRWSGAERLLLVYIERQTSIYVVQVREFDPQFQILGPVIELQTTQREMVPDFAGRAVLQAFSAVAEVRSATGNVVQVSFLAGSRLRPFRAWLGLDGNAGLQVLREPLAAGLANSADEGGPRSTRYRRTFLKLHAWDGELAECELIGPDRLFQDLGSGPARYIARPVRGGATSPRVQVLRKEGRQPQPDCEVFVSPQQYSTESGSLRGLTDRAGTLRIDLASGLLQFVSVRYEDLVIKAPLLPGASNDPLVFEVPTRGRRTEFVRPLKQLIQEIDDQYLVDLRLKEELATKVKEKDTAELRKLIERGKRKRITLEEVEQRVREVELRARTEGEDVIEAAASVREAAARRISKQLDQALATYGEYAERIEKANAVQGLVGRINDMQNQMDWDGLLPLFEQLAAADPENKDYADRLRLLRNDLRVKSSEHGRARTFVDEQIKRITIRDLDDQWPEIDSTVHTLLDVKDHLTLLKAQRAMSGWAREISVQVKGLIDQIQAASQDEDRVQEIQLKLDRLNDVNQSFQKLFKEVDDFLRKLNLAPKGSR